MDRKLLKKFLWIVMYVDIENCTRISKDIKTVKAFEGIKAVVPTVKIIKKKFKGKVKYEKIPLLFEYGFIRIPREMYSEELLKDLKDKIPGIRGFMKDPMQTKYTKPCLDNDEKTIKRDHTIPYGLTTKAKVMQLKEVSKTQGIYTKSEVKTLQPGVVITLRKYPFENLNAKVLSVNTKKKKLKVELIDGNNQPVTISFENALYSIYQGGFQEDLMGHRSLDETRFSTRNSNDKIFYRNGAN